MSSLNNHTNIHYKSHTKDLKLIIKAAKNTGNLNIYLIAEMPSIRIPIPGTYSVGVAHSNF